MMYKRFLTTLGMVALMAGLVFLFEVSSLTARGDKTAEKKIYLRSAYLISELKVGEKAYRRLVVIAVLKGEDGAGELFLDWNACGLNQFGDTHICTRMAPDRVEIKLKRLRTEDPEKLHRELYSITGNGLPKPLFLVVPTTDKASFRFVIGDETSGATVVVTLEPFASVAKKE